MLHALIHLQLKHQRRCTSSTGRKLNTGIHGYTSAERWYSGSSPVPIATSHGPFSGMKYLIAVGQQENCDGFDIVLPESLNIAAEYGHADGFWLITPRT